MCLLTKILQTRLIKYEYYSSLKIFSVMSLTFLPNDLRESDFLFIFFINDFVLEIINIDPY